tara:strand:+ start:118 stop:276 length:159 start_codon:yes stop_codon:yes gene_type:complete
MAGKQAKRLTEQQKERLKDPRYLIALRAVKPLVRQGQRMNRQARRQERRAAR